MARSLLNWKKTQTKNLTMFMVLVIWLSSTLKFFLFLISINICAIFSLRDFWQITFVTLNRFCPLSTPPPFPHAPVLNQQNQAGWNPKQNLMKNTCLWVHCISSFEVTSYKKYKIELVLPVPLFLVVLHHISLYISRISRYHMSFFKTF